jgi:hypothetical protein
VKKMSTNGPDEEREQEENDATAEAAAEAMKDTCDDILTRIEGLDPDED